MTLRALDRKMLRDLWRMRGQALAIGLVMACGVATFVMSVTTLDSLEGALDTYYSRYRFAEVFAHLDRAPNAVEPRLVEIPGVARLQTRVVEAVTIDVENMAEPAMGRLISVPDHGAPVLNDLHLRRGRLLSGRRNEVLLGEAFADAQALGPGDHVDVVMNGTRERLAIAGVVLSPEYVYQIRDGEILPDDKRYAVMWMSRRELASAFDMEGAFNDVALTLERGADPAEVIDRLDALTAAYGGLGAYERKDQTSHLFVSNEIAGLRVSTVIIPMIFLSVAAFLFNVVLTRLVTTQREQIAALKALGYGRAAIAAHFLKLVLMIAAFSVVLGGILGAWMGAKLTEIYAMFYRFPVFEYRMSLGVTLGAFAVSAGAAIAGTLGAVRSAASLPPAEAMRPEPPASYRATLIERSGFQNLLSPAARMILRQLERRPARFVLSCSGIALATAVLVVGNFMQDSMDYAMDLDFSASQRQDVLVTFIEPTSSGALMALASMPGVRDVEPLRVLSARLRAGHRSKRVGITGLDPAAKLLRIIDTDERTVAVPPRGLVLSAKLAEQLAVEAGDVITVEVLQEQRPVRRIAVAALVDDRVGLSAYMSLDAIHDLMHEGGTVNGAYLSAYAHELDALYSELKLTPRVAGVAVKQAALDSFRATIAKTMNQMRVVNVLFAIVIACGVVYNTARISLSERSRELATLRVMGFTRGEVSLIQLGELATITVLAVPGGLLLGYGFAAAAVAAYDLELFRLPLVIEPSTYGFAAAVVFVAAGLSGLVVRRMLDRLDLIAVLKTRE